MSILKNAEGVEIYNGTFNSVKKAIINNHPTELSSIKALREHVATGALHDAAERFNPPKCHPETRVAILDTIDRWALIGHHSPPILWLHGAAGAGKSAIAQTLADRWSKSGLLAASFFFRRRYTRRNTMTYLIPTLAYQISLSILATPPHIERAIAKDMCIFSKNIDRQVEALVVQPLKSVNDQHQPLDPVVIVIDGLDECCQDLSHATYEEQQRDILHAIASISFHNLPLKFLIASRPEHQIRESFAERVLVSMSEILALTRHWDPDADIELFLQCKFDEIKQKHTFLRGTAWLPEDTITHLVEKSSGNFSYPSTVIRYISAPRTDPRRRLRIVLGVGLSSELVENPFSELDALYRHILQAVAPCSRRAVFDILECLCYDMGSGSGAFPGIVDLSPAFLEKLQFIEPGQIYVHLTDLHSILDIPPPELSKSLPLQFLHASFADFLLDQSRSREFAASLDRATLSHFVNWFKHALIASATAQPSPEYDQAIIQDAISLRLATMCPPSLKMKHGLEAAMGADDQRYHQYLRSVDMGSLISEYRLRLLGSLHIVQYHEILQYLQKCNVKELESSLLRRWSTRRRLSRLITQLDKHTCWEHPLGPTVDVGVDQCRMLAIAVLTTGIAFIAIVALKVFAVDL